MLKNAFCIYKIVVQACSFSLKALFLTIQRQLRRMSSIFIFFWPNMAVKGTRRTQALLKVGDLFGFVGFAKPSQSARPLLLR
ncbi:MAG: hypothetical protein CTY19_00450 [Methylomonas sp.]|nr:MAG: hypothetical protein CTY19_00450 [Methylomonas sp.]